MPPPQSRTHPTPTPCRQLSLALSWACRLPAPLTNRQHAHSVPGASTCPPWSERQGCVAPICHLPSRTQCQRLTSDPNFHLPGWCGARGRGGAGSPERHPRPRQRRSGSNFFASCCVSDAQTHIRPWKAAAIAVRAQIPWSVPKAGSLPSTEGAFLQVFPCICMKHP